MLHEATDANFDAMLARFPSALVDFYATWCGPCKALVPQLVEASRVIPVIKVDVEKCPTLMRRFRVQAMPTLILFRRGAQVEAYIGVPPRGLRAWLSTAGVVY